jgi:hypothetical protein
MDFVSTREGRALKFVRLLPVRQTAKDRDRERLSSDIPDRISVNDVDRDEWRLANREI